ncbi:MAG: flagellin [Candidatus Caenarcaniphilales bacterium]|nr:flagellin [Candidatus Caenarcaniphilales bacterium]
MGIVLNTNTSSLFANRALRHAGDQTVKTTEKLSTGLRINRAGDDSAGMSISTKIDTRLRGINSAQKNIQNAMGVIDQTQSGLLEVFDELQAIREIAIQAYNSTSNSEDEIDMLQNAVNTHVGNIQRIRDVGSTKTPGYGANVFRGTVDAPASEAGYSGEFQTGSDVEDVTVLDFTDNVNVNNTIELGTDLNVAGSISEGASDTLANFNIGSLNVSSFSGTTTGVNGTLADIDIMLENMARMSSVTEGYKVSFETSFDELETLKYAFNSQKKHYEGTDFAEVGPKHIMNEFRMQSAANVLTQANSINNVALGLLP